MVGNDKVFRLKQKCRVEVRPKVSEKKEGYGVAGRAGQTRRPQRGGPWHGHHQEVAIANF